MGFGGAKGLSETLAWAGVVGPAKGEDQGREASGPATGGVPATGAPDPPGGMPVPPGGVPTPGIDVTVCWSCTDEEGVEVGGCVSGVRGPVSATVAPGPAEAACGGVGQVCVMPRAWPGAVSAGAAHGSWGASAGSPVPPVGVARCAASSPRASGFCASSDMRGPPPLNVPSC